MPSKGKAIARVAKPAVPNSYKARTMLEPQKQQCSHSASMTAKLVASLKPSFLLAHRKKRFVASRVSKIEAGAKNELLFGPIGGVLLSARCDGGPSSTLKPASKKVMRGFGLWGPFRLPRARGSAAWRPSTPFFVSSALSAVGAVGRYS